MFENIFSNFKTTSSKITDSMSVASLKDKTSKISESLYNIGHSFMHKTNSLSSYLSNNQCNDNPSNRTSFSTPNLINNKENGLKTSTHIHNNRVDYVQFNPIADFEDVEDDIVDKFVRVVNIEEDRHSLNRQYSFRVSP